MSMHMMKRLFLAGNLMSCLLAWSSPVISDLKVSSVEPLGLALDYTVSGAKDTEALQNVEVTMTVGDTTYAAKNLAGATNCVNGAHRVYWNMAEDGLTLDVTNAVVSVAYKVHALMGEALYCVIDLSAGSSATSYPVTYLDAEPDDGFFNSIRYKTTRLVLKRVNAGTFTMGDSSEYLTRAHTVTLTKPFYMGLYEVTQKQWQLVMGSKPSLSQFSGTANPVDCVSYNDIRGSSKGANWPATNSVDSTSFLGKLRDRTRLEFDLPTEAQWEYTCRAGTATTYSYGDDADGDYMWYADNSLSMTHEVGTKKANPWGFYDMHGNVEEWCLDWTAGIILSDGEDPVGSSSGSRRAKRGGSWDSKGDYCTSSYRRGHNAPACGGSEDGFRLCRTFDANDDVLLTVTDVATNVSCRVIATGSEVGCVLKLGVVPAGSAKASVSVDGEVVVDVTEATSTTWRVKSAGMHTVTHTVGSVSISATYLVKGNKIISYSNLKGATHTNQMSYLEGTEVAFSDPSEVVGYTFTGWTPSAITADMTGDLIVEANWMANAYTIRYDANGGEGVTDTTECVYDSEAVVAENGFVRAGCDFQGWATEENGSVVYAPGAKITNLVSTQNGSIVFYAVWKRTELKVNLLKVTSIEPLGLAIDYTVNGAEAIDVARPLEISMSVGDVTYTAKNLAGATNCVNGAHRVYWNMAEDGLTLDVTNSAVKITYKAPVLTDDALYCVIDLSEGPFAPLYPVTYLDREPSEGFNTTEYKTTKLVLKRVNAGTFTMGDSSESHNQPHTVTLTKPFYMGLFEVTQKQWALVTNSSYYCSGDADTHPVARCAYNNIRGTSEGAKWPVSNAVDASSFLGKLRARTRQGFDLPTEAQWEYTCRAGTTTTYSYGDSVDGDYMWYFDNSSDVGTREVGTRLPNPWGFYDMHGNVEELCLDWFATSTPSGGTDPKGSSSGSYRVSRGGCSYSNGASCSSFERSVRRPDIEVCGYGDGLRLCRSFDVDDEAVSSTATNVSCRVIATGTEVEGSLTLGAVPTEEMHAVITVNDEEVVNTAAASRITWLAPTAGVYRVVHTVGDFSLTGMYNVSLENVSERYSIVYANLKGATHTNPATYKEGTGLTFVAPSAVEGWTFTGWTPAAITADMTGNQTVVANWKIESVPNPVVTPSDGTVFTGDSCTVSLSCALDGVKIYYRTDGKTPKTNDTYLYTGAFTVTDTVEIKAVAVYDGVKSAYVTVTITKKTLTLAESLGLGDATGVALTTGGDAEWTPIVDATATLGMSARSGAVGDDGESWLKATVNGVGVFTFKWKTDCEYDDSGAATWDHLEVLVDGEEFVRTDGETAWEEKTITFSTAGEHTICWTYAKDESDASGEDCAWVTECTWTPSGAREVTIAPTAGGASFTIPADWFAQYPTLGGTTVAEWQAVAEGNGVKAAPVWQDYVAGTDPTNALSQFTANIEMKGGTPIVTWSPALNGEGVREGSRTYRVWGKANLDDAAWSEVEAGNESAYRFFRVTVEMP